MVGRMTRALSIVLVVCLIVPPSYARSTAVASGGDREVIVQPAPKWRAGRPVPGALSGPREAPSVDAGPRDVVRPLDFLTADQISVTENGFEPETLTVTAGSPVTWTNTTPQTHILVSGVPWRIYLPLVLRQTTSQARSIAGLGPETSTFIHNTVLFTATLPPSGSFRYTFVTTGTYPYYLSTAPQFTGQVVVQAPRLPSDPSAVAPPLDETVATTMISATAFLYSGDDPIQTGVAPGTIEAKRVAVLRGQVKDRSGAPISGVTITILDHPEYGQTLTREDGAFDMAVNGGGELVVQYQKVGYLPLQRDIQVPWQDYIWLPDVVLITQDTQATGVDLGTGEVQVAQGSLVSDDDGTRQATVLIPSDTQAEITGSDGTTQTVNALNVRATEFTVGDSGPVAMPAELPSASGYTYAVDLGADEAAGQEIAFDQPMPVYLENFLEIPTGVAVPVGYYDDEVAVWLPSNDGRVIEILAISDGLAELDTMGDGLADNGAALGITEAERTRLATLYGAGQSMWRFTVDHFSAWDANFRWGPPLLAKAREMFEAMLGKMKGVWCAVAGCDRPGSQVGVQNQTLGEAVDARGTPYTLHYDSSRVPGRRAEHVVEIPLSDEQLPPDLKRIDLEIRVAGRLFTESFTPQPGLDYTFTWDGLDAYGRRVQGMARAEIAIGYVYDGVYQSIEGLSRSFGYSGNGTPITTSREEVTLWETYDVAIGGWNARGLGLGGWSLSVHHAYDPTSRVLYRGDGGRQSTTGFADVIDTVAGSGPYNPYENDLPATEVHVDHPVAVVVTEDDTFYLSEYGQCQIRYVDQEGIIRHVAGKWDQLFPCRFEGDGGPATDAGLDHPTDLAWGPDGSLYVADTYNHRIRRIDASGIITTVVGSGPTGQGNGGFGGDDGPATAARLNEPRSVAVSLDGSLYVADTLNHRVRQVRPDGTINTVAGTGTIGYSGDGGAAAEAQLTRPEALSLGSDGSLYIVENVSTAYNGYDRVRRVDANGIITTVVGVDSASAWPTDGAPATDVQVAVYGILAGPGGGFFFTGHRWGDRVYYIDPEGLLRVVAGPPADEIVAEQMPPKDDGPAIGAYFWGVQGLALAPDGKLYIADQNNGRIRQIGLSLPGFGYGAVSMPSPDGRELYQFDAYGRHMRTVDTLTGTPIYTFTYDNATDLLIGVEDRDGDVTTIERTDGITPTAIVAPFGQRTVLTVNTDGYLSSVTDPVGNVHAFNYSVDGLLQGMTDPRDNLHAYQYDTLGRLTRDVNPAGGHTSLARTDSRSAYTTTVRTAEGLTTTYRVGFLDTGAQTRVNTFPNGARHQAVIGVGASTRITFANGARVYERQGGDPRFGTQAPLRVEQTVDTPGGRAYALTRERTVSMTVPGDPLSLAALTDTLTINGRPYTRTYDAATRTWTQTSPEGRTSLLRLDDEGRLVALHVTGIEAALFSYDGHGRVDGIAHGARQSNLAYDPDSGYLAHRTDAVSNTTAYLHDAAGRLITRTLPDGATWGYAWDGNGNGNLAALTEPGGGAPHVFTYTLDDQLGLYRSPLGAEERFNYDLDGRLVQRVFPSTDAIEWLYDDQGQLTTLHTPEGDHIFGYDDVTGLLTRTLSRDDQQVVYDYDGGLLTGAGWRGLVTDTVHYVYNDDLRVSQMDYATVSLVLRYDDDELLTGVGGISLTRRADNGMLASMVDGELYIGYGYNAYGELGAVTATHGVMLYQVDYTRDALGRITEKVETIGGSTHTWHYNYDAVGQLVEARRDGTLVESYTYDAVGNRTAMNNTLTGVTVPGGGYTYDGDHKLLTAGSASYIYDADGRLHTVDRGGGDTTTYTYNTDGTLAGVQTDGQSITYQYDARGRRVARSVDGARTHAWLYGQGLMPLAEYDGSGDLRSVFVYAGGPTPVRMVRGGMTYHIVSDHLGSVRLVVDETGSVVKQIDYDSFGSVVSDTNPGFDLPFGFAGGMVDPDHELVRFGSRDYQPSTGRWTTKDPLLFRGGDHLYGYVGNDPVNHADRTGLQTGLEIALLGSVVFLGGLFAAIIFQDAICELFQSEQTSRQTYQPFDFDTPPTVSYPSPTVATNPVISDPLYNSTTELTGVVQTVHPDGSLSFTVDGQDVFLSPSAINAALVNPTIEATGASEFNIGEG